MKLTRKCIYNLILGITCIILLVIFAVKPYFSYGEEEIVLMPDGGFLGLLDGKWVTEKTEGMDGYYSLMIAGRKDISVKWQKDGTKGQASANYKYSRASKELSLNIQDENGNTIKQIQCEFNPLLILGGRTEVPLLKYLITPFEHEKMDKEIAVNHEEYFINRAIVFPLVIMIVLVVAIILAFIYHDKSVASYLIAGDSILAIIVYLLNPLLCFGQDRLFHIICFIVLLILSGYIIWQTVFIKNQNTVGF